MTYLHPFSEIIYIYIICIYIRYIDYTVIPKVSWSLVSSSARILGAYCHGN